METILVNEQTSSTSSGRSLHNRVSWQSINGQRIIIAIGSPEEWHSAAALPMSATTTDLVVASTEDPALASLLWGAFLAYLVRPQVPAWHFALPRFLRPPLLVSVRLPVGHVSSAVSSAIERSQGPLRFKVHAAA
jgi:hypothetical protein